MNGLVKANQHKEPMPLPFLPKRRRSSRRYPIRRKVGRSVDCRVLPSEPQKRRGIDGAVNQQPLVAAALVLRHRVALQHEIRDEVNPYHLKNHRANLSEPAPPHA